MAQLNLKETLSMIWAFSIMLSMELGQILMNKETSLKKRIINYSI